MPTPAIRYNGIIHTGASHDAILGDLRAARALRFPAPDIESGYYDDDEFTPLADGNAEHEEAMQEMKADAKRQTRITAEQEFIENL